MNLRTCESIYWKDVVWFVHFEESNVPHANMEEDVGLVMCLPGSNAFVERILSLELHLDWRVGTKGREINKPL